MASQESGTTPPVAQPRAVSNMPAASNAEAHAPFSGLSQPSWRPKERHDEEESSSERWLVSYADFVTLLMAMFMMLYALQLVKNKDIAVSELRRPETTESAPAAAQQAVPDKAQELMASLAPLRDKGEIKLTRTATGVEIAVNARLLFASGDARLLPNALPVLKEIAKTLRETPRNNILVEGHTDSQPISNGRFESNWELSSARAGVVVRYLVEHGLEPYRLVSMGRADNVPAALGDSPEAYAANRRVTILVQY